MTLQQGLDGPDVSSGEALVHEHQGFLAGGTGLLCEALHKEAPVLVVSDTQGCLLAASSQI